MSQTPAGWYPDPTQGGRQRYWDGNRWTNHFHPPAPPATPPPPRPTPTQTPTPKPVAASTGGPSEPEKRGPAEGLRKQIRLYPIAALAIAALVGILLGAAGAATDTAEKDDLKSEVSDLEDELADAEDQAGSLRAEVVEAERDARLADEKAKKLAADQRAAAEKQEKQAASSPEPSPEPSPVPAAGGNCEPGYDPCVPTYPPDIDCADLGTGWRGSGEGGIKVTGSDPHILDLDGDGYGCEL